MFQPLYESLGCALLQAQANSLRCDISHKHNLALQAEFLHIADHTDVEIYIIGAPLKCVPIPI